jgi:hypothetical protein
MTTQPAMFDVEPLPAAEPDPPQSATVRRTRRQAAMLANRRHPLSSPLGYSLFLHAEAAPADDRDAPGRRCGNCRFRQILGHHDSRYPKCVAPGLMSADAYERLGPPRVSHGEATDVRAWWPGCKDHEWGDPALSPDSARSVPEAGSR